MADDTQATRTPEAMDGSRGQRRGTGVGVDSRPHNVNILKENRLAARIHMDGEQQGLDGDRGPRIFSQPVR